MPLDGSTHNRPTQLEVYLARTVQVRDYIRDEVPESQFDLNRCSHCIGGYVSMLFGLSFDEGFYHVMRHLGLHSQDMFAGTPEIWGHKEIALVRLNKRIWELAHAYL